MANTSEKICFVVGPVGGDDSDTRTHADWLLEAIIEPVFKEHFTTYRVVRSDRMPKPGMIDNEMIRYLVEADLVIADMTFLNPNAFYEIGIRHMKQMPIVHMHLVGQVIPFDVALHRSIAFSLKRPSDLKAAREGLRAAIEETEKPDFKVTNPITHALGMAKINTQADPALVVVTEEIRSIGERLSMLELVEKTAPRPTRFPHLIVEIAEAARADWIWEATKRLFGEHGLRSVEPSWRSDRTAFRVRITAPRAVANEIREEVSSLLGVTSVDMT